MREDKATLRRSTTAWVANRARTARCLPIASAKHNHAGSAGLASLRAAFSGAGSAGAVSPASLFVGRSGRSASAHARGRWARLPSDAAGS